MSPGRRAAWLLFALAPAIACGTSALAEQGYRLLLLDSRPVKWGRQVLGSGARVTYAFARREMHFPKALNCPLVLPMDRLLSRSGLSAAAFAESFAQAARMWEEATDVTFLRVENPEAADIVVGARGEPGGWAYADVVHRPTAEGEAAPIEHATICFNPQRRWKLGFDGDTSVFDLRYTAAHELGHAIGLDHAGPSGEIMSFKYEELYAALQAGDRAGAVRLYGPPSHSRAEDGPSGARLLVSQPCHGVTSGGDAEALAASRVPRVSALTGAEAADRSSPNDRQDDPQVKGCH